MRVIRKIDMIANVAESFKTQYFVRGKGWKQFDWDTEATYEQLKALPRNATEEEVISILNNSWTQNLCNECAQDVEIVIEVGQEEDYESSTAWICLECLEKALVLGRAAT